MNIIFIVNVDLKNGRNNPYYLGIKSWKYWADKNNAKVIELTEPIINPEILRVNLHRYWALDILKENNIEFENVLLVDADTIVHPDCPNFFEESKGKMGVVINNGCYEWTKRSILQWRDGLFPDMELVKVWNYFNSGFITLNKSHKEFLDKVKNFYLDNQNIIPELTKKIKAGTDQTIVNFLVKKYNQDITYLSECYNLQDLFRKNLLHVPGHSWYSDDLHFIECGWVYHFNAIPQNPRHVEYWMTRTFEHFYGNNK